jgi:lipoate-protein ligase A
LTIALLSLQTLSAAEAAALSCAPHPIDEAHQASLLVAEITTEALLLGAFERNLDAGGLPVFRRGSGGGAAHVGPGVVFVQLVLRSPSALTPAGPDQILNRYVRPVLRALTRTGSLAHYFGRDFLSVKRTPAALAAFAHTQATQQTVVELFIGADRDVFGDTPRASFAGKTSASLRALTGRPTDVPGLVDAIREAFASAYGHALVPTPCALPASPSPLALEAPWSTSIDEAIGPVFAGKDASSNLRLGGTFMASQDVIAHVERLAAEGATEDQQQQVLHAPGVALFGLRDPSNLLRALRQA